MSKSKSLVLAGGGSHRLRDAHGFHAYGGDAQQQVDDLFLVVGEAIGVEFFADGGVFGFLLFVLVEYPIERATVAELVSPCFVKLGDVLALGVFNPFEAFAALGAASAVA